jgi:hypothetical protein
MHDRRRPGATAYDPERHGGATAGRPGRRGSAGHDLTAGSGTGHDAVGVTSAVELDHVCLSPWAIRD